jgi:radical SAM superfamily enzyme YgiQ (UPF0313 family)
LKICLISPKWNKLRNSYPPLGLAYLAAYLEREGHQARIFDLGLDPNTPLEQDVEAILSFAPDLIGLTAMTSNYEGALATARALKAASAAPIVIGGPHATVLPERVMQETCFDYLVHGEGEFTLAELVKLLETCRFRLSADDLRRIEGLYFRCNGELAQNPERPLIRDLDALPYPARHLLELKRYGLVTPDGQPMISILSSRGCPYNCSYCFKGIVGRIYRQRSAENIIAELRQVIAGYGVRNFYFIDDLFAVNERRLRELTQRLIDEKLDIRWQCLDRVDKVTPELLGLMYRAGCRELHYGIESGNQQVLDAIGKRITLEQVRQAVKWTHDSGILVKGYFMLGLPGDTEETMEQTIQFASELELDEAMFSLTTPFPGTRLWDELCLRRPDTQFDADFSHAFYYNSYTEEIAPFLNVSEVSDKRLAQLIRQAEARFWEGKRRRKYGQHFGRPWGRWIWQLSRLPAVRAAGRFALNSGLYRQGRTLRQGRTDSWF